MLRLSKSILIDPHHLQATSVGTDAFCSVDAGAVCGSYRPVTAAEHPYSICIKEVGGLSTLLQHGPPLPSTADLAYARCMLGLQALSVNLLWFATGASSKEGDDFSYPRLSSATICPHSWMADWSSRSQRSPADEADKADKLSLM